MRGNESDVQANIPTSVSSSLIGHSAKSISRIPAMERVRTGWQLGWIGLGAAFGFLVVAAMMLVYYALISGGAVAQTLEIAIRDKLTGLGIDHLWKFGVLGSFYALFHSFLEEYYWRWFVFRHLTQFFNAWAAVLISSIGFMAHHIVVLGYFFGWTSPLTYLFSAGVAVGGAFWAWLYYGSGRLVSPWISHLIVDAGIFLLGYFIITV
jgi:membrane protease YdiL (CAAX protease family)